MAIDPAALLAPIAAEAPSGVAVEYDPQYNELETLARGTPEREVGNTIVPAEDPDWREVERIALELSAKSMDLRVAVYLMRAELKVMGLPGLAAGLQVIKGYVADFWPTIHPQLDPEDDNDPGARVNALMSLCDAELVLPAVRALPLTQSRQLGRITYRDHAIATGLLPPPPPKKGQEKDKPKYPDSATIEAAFADTPLEAIQEFQAAAASSLDALAGIDTALNQVLGAARGPDLDPLRKLVREIKGLLDHELAKRGASDGATAPSEAMAEPGAGPVGGPAVGTAGVSGAIRGRNDVVLLLEKICRYYSDYEPSSPVPLLLERAQRLVMMNFMDIIKDLTPDSLQTVNVITGIRDEAQ